jgi:hypothetical protein
MNARYDPRADKITVAITEAIIASQRDDEHPSLSYVETDTTLKALAVVAARIAFETKIADTAPRALRSPISMPRWSATLSKLSGRAATSIRSPACSMTTPM